MILKKGLLLCHQSSTKQAMNLVQVQLTEGHPGINPMKVQHNNIDFIMVLLNSGLTIACILCFLFLMFGIAKLLLGLGDLSQLRRIDQFVRRILESNDNHVTSFVCTPKVLI